MKIFLKLNQFLYFLEIYLRILWYLRYLPPFLKESQLRTYFGQLNVNSIRSKFESVQRISQNSFDIFLDCEAKIDSSLLDQQFYFPGYRLFRKDRNARGGGLPFNINQSLICKVLNKYSTRQDLEILVLELKLLKLTG